jgi:hypothetical protein
MVIFIGIFPEDHPLFFGVCSGLDAVIVDFFAKSDLLRRQIRPGGIRQDLAIRR